MQTGLHGWPQKQHGSPPWNDCQEAQTAVRPKPQSHGVDWRSVLYPARAGRSKSRELAMSAHGSEMGACWTPLLQTENKGRKSVRKSVKIKSAFQMVTANLYLVISHEMFD